MKAKRILALLLTAVLVVSLLPTAALADGEPAQVDGVYQIGTAAELRWFADKVNEEMAKDAGLVTLSAVLTADIDLGGEAWTPIASASSYVVDAYAGTFDGQGHSITGLNVSGSANQGLFGIVNTGAVKNLKVSGTVSGTNAVGGIVGKLQTGTIENCSFAGSVSASGRTGHAGGIVGNISAANAAVTGCSSSADVSGTHAGGILGANTGTKNPTTIAYCYNTGKITGSTRSGGIVGQLQAGTISYCYSVGESNCGIAAFSNATITACYYLEQSGEPGGAAAGYEKITDADALLTALNAGDQQRFVADNANKNGGWPLLDWQADAAAPVVPVTTVNLTGDAVTGASLSAEALGEGGEKATNVTWEWAISDDGETYTDIEGANASGYTIPDTAEFAGKYLRATATGEAGSTASAVVGPIEKSDALIAQENAAAVQDAAAALNVSPTVVKEPMTLTLVTEQDGCAVSWASDNESIITPAGVVTLPEKNIVTVTLTATVTKGEASATQTFAIDVWAGDVDADVYLQSAKDALKWSLSALNPKWGEDTNILVKLSDLLHGKGYDGITVTVASTSDESLISSNGKITYPALDKNSFADGRQVTVVFTLSAGGKSVTWPDSGALLVPWDLSEVESDLNAAADEALTENAIRAENETLADVKTDLTLPACLNKDGGKFSFAWVTWESSDPAHLSVEDGPDRVGADGLYAPYAGVPHPDSEPHDVTLTATITNPATGTAVTRSFTVTVAPVDQEQQQRDLDALVKLYVAAKLTDMATKAPIDPAAVTADMQLLTTRRLATADELAALGLAGWDYWNYKLTVTSSDPDTVDVSGYRANVYRPIGEDASADKPVTLTVKLERRDNPNLSAETTLSVTVKHLSRAELNAALGRMEAAKEAYAAGLLGSNSDAWSVIDDLTPYVEMVQNADGSFTYIRASRDTVADGILIDALPGWEDQEAWRSFRTSDSGVLAHETLRLGATPEDNTFVKVESVLTDAQLGGYYDHVKDIEGYDAEALAKLAQLQKQPVSAWFMVVGQGKFTEDFAAMTTAEREAAYADDLKAAQEKAAEAISVTFTLIGLDGVVLIPKNTVEGVSKGDTVFSVFRKQLGANAIVYEAQGSYVSMIGGVAEFDHGPNSGWMYTVGGVYVNSYMNAQTLSGGEDIVVRYVRDYTKANDPEPERKCLKFTDIDMWAHDSICFVVERDIMNGMSETLFQPETKVSRAMAVTVLYRLAGSPKVDTPAAFTDVPENEWYTDAVAWAAASGITNGRSETIFAPGADVTRAELVTFLMRYAAWNKQDVTMRDDLSRFTDRSDVPAWASDAMQWAVKAGLISGMTETTLVPAGTATRAQLATVLARMMQ